MPAPHDEYARKAQALPETMFARRPVLENVLRGLLLGGTRRANVHTVAGSVRTLELARAGAGSRVAAVVVRQVDGGEITINEPVLVAGASLFTHASYPC